MGCIDLVKASTSLLSNIRRPRALFVHLYPFHVLILVQSVACGAKPSLSAMIWKVAPGSVDEVLASYVVEVNFHKIFLEPVQVKSPQSLTLAHSTGGVGIQARASRLQFTNLVPDQ